MLDDSREPMVDRRPNPKEKANFLSSVTFFFTLGLVRKGFKREIKEDDIYRIIRKHDSSRLADNLEHEWIKEQSEDDPSLFRTLRKTFGKEFLIYCFIQILFKTPTTILRTISLREILDTFDKNRSEKSESGALYYGIAFILCTFFLTIYTHTYLLCMQEIAMKIRVSLCSLVYRKCIRLKSATIGEFTIGNLVTLVSKDVREFENFVIAFQDSIVGLIHIFVFVYLMYVHVGVASLIATACILAPFPLQVLLSRTTTLKRLRTAAQTDKRLKIVEEVLSSIRIIKMYTWENYFVKTINQFRRNEIFNLRIVFYLKSLITHLSVVAVRFGIFAAILYYTSKDPLPLPANIYLVVSCMHTIRMVTAVDFPKLLASSAEIVASVKRLQLLLMSDDANLYLNMEDFPHMNANDPSIEINATIGIKDNPSFLRADLKLGKKLIALTGPLGSGTTLFIKTLQGDLPYKGDIKINGTISYAAQEPWLFPGTIRQNILFGKKYIKDRYHKILRICALEKDIHNFPKGDETIINDDGICLSRGQQGRINLARALYKEADIYLLDNCLSSLDTNIKNHIFEHCMKSFLKDKLCIYSTNRDTYFKQADVILTIRKGQVEIIDNHEKITKIPLDKQDDIEEDYSGIIYKSGLVEADEKTKLIEQDNHMYHEENKSGKVPFGIYKEYLRRTGYIHLFLLLLIYIVYQAASSGFEKFIQQWADDERKTAPLINTTNVTDLDYYSTFNVTNATRTISQVQIRRFQKSKVFLVIMTAVTISYLLKTYLFYYMTAKTSKKLHKLTFVNVIHAPISFFDDNLVGNIMNRFSKDVGAIDEYIPIIMEVLLQHIFMCLGALALIGINSLSILILSIILVGLVWMIRWLYIPVCRSLKRLEAATRSPVIGLLRTSLEGVNTIRSSGMSRQLREEFDRHQNLHTSADYTYMTVNRALCFCVEFILSIYLAGVVLVCIFYLSDSTPGKVGLILMQSYGISKFLQTLIRSFADLENQMTSVERVLEYREIEPESKAGVEHENWPKNGKIEYDKVNLRYPKTNQLVLKDISFCISPKERVCLIGRTGAGKTSMLSTLFRLYEPESGNIRLDDSDSSKVNLQTLRRGISIIPQNPILFTGDLRSNLDPNQKYSDDVLWKALNEVHLKELCQDVITLDTKINEGFKTFSAGQKQLICLARALMQQNKILVLDEATSYLDNDTSDVIDSLISTKFSDCTIITILHRLKTVMNYDKVMILKDGYVVEFDNPHVLLKDQNSVFHNIMSKEN